MITKFRFLYDSIVIIYVGPGKSRFDVHKGLLCSVSDFFKAACNGQFIEGKGIVTLPEQEESTFRYFVYWLYTGKLRGLFYPATREPSIKELEISLRQEIVRQDWRKEMESEDYENDPIYIAKSNADCEDAPFDPAHLVIHPGRRPSGKRSKRFSHKYADSDLRL